MLACWKTEEICLQSSENDRLAIYIACVSTPGLEKNLGFLEIVFRFFLDLSPNKWTQNFTQEEHPIDLYTIHSLSEHFL